MSENAISLNIAILVNEDVAEQSIEMSSAVSNRFSTEFTLNNQNFLPHITLYQAHFPTSSLGHIKQKMHELAQNISSFEINLSSITINYETFLWWNCFKNSQFVGIQKQVVKALNPLREGHILPHLSNIRCISKEDQNDIQQFGSLLIGPRYLPHITLTRLRNSSDGANALKMLQKRVSAKFYVNKIILGYLGNHGIVTKAIEIFKTNKN